MTEIDTQMVIELESLLEEWEQACLTLSENTDDLQTIKNLLLCMHTLKGLIRSSPYPYLSPLIHHSEELFIHVADHDLEITPQIIEIGLRIKDYLESARNALASRSSFDRDVKFEEQSLHKIINLIKVKKLEKEGKGGEIFFDPMALKSLGLDESKIKELENMESVQPIEKENRGLSAAQGQSSAVLKVMLDDVNDIVKSIEEISVQLGILYRGW